MVEGEAHIVRFANPAFCRLMHRAAEDLCGKPLAELLPERDECIRLLDRVYRDCQPEFHIEQEDSQPHPVFWSYTMWPLTEEGNLVGIMLQVTETAEVHAKTIAMNEALLLGAIRQHEMTEAAEDLNAQLRAEVVARQAIARELSEKAEQLAEKARLLDLTYDAIIVRGAAGEIRYWNHGAEELYGWSRSEALGKISHILLRTEYSTPLPEITEILFRTGRWAGELIHTTRGGRRIIVFIRKTMDRDSDGNPKAVLENITDITARRALEDSLSERAEQLARADRSKDEFLAMLAHELRNPLAPLRNAAEILETPQASPGERGQALRIIRRQLENMARMIDDLLDVSRITEGKIELREESVALQAILRTSADLARPALTAHRQELLVSMPSDPIFLNADATRLEQVFSNLLNNACKYSGEGSRVSIVAERGASAESPEAIVRVADDGVGIDPELLPRIFDLFVQANRAPDRAHGGLGIGLTLVRRLVTLHGGSVEAHSRGWGYGCEFVVRLPILREAPAAPVAPSLEQPETPRRILIVDDNTDSANSMAMLQSRRGHMVRTAFTGPEALAIAPDFLPEVVLLDIGLPGMDGHEVARRLRKMPATSNSLLLAMTGYASPADRLATRDAGFDDHLVKPVDLEALRNWLVRGK